MNEVFRGRFILRDDFDSFNSFIDSIIDTIEEIITETGLPPVGWRYEVFVMPTESGAIVSRTDFLSSGARVKYDDNEVVLPVDLQAHNIPYYPEYYGYYPLLLMAAGLSKEKAEMVPSWEEAKKILQEKLGPNWSKKIPKEVWEKYEKSAEETLLSKFLSEHKLYLYSTLKEKLSCLADEIS